VTGTLLRAIAPGVTVLLAAAAMLAGGAAAAQPTPVGAAAPDLAGGGAWINSAPLTLAGLRGRVVAVEFWTYG
jgi:hypothetical protein